MKKRILLLFLLALRGGSNGLAQFDLPSNPLFIDKEVARIDITINPSYLQAILSPGNEGSNVEYPATFRFTSSDYSVQVDSVGFRLRGNTSRYAQKKSYKVSFNTFTPGQKVKGVEKLNLNGEHNDPSIIRSKLCWDLLNEAGVPSPRANHVVLYINNQYHGLYINVEHVDENFVMSRFGNSNGNLYKCLYPADLTYRSSDPNAYKFMQNGYRVYDLKTNTEQDSYSDLAQLIDIVNRTPVSEMPAKLEPIFNVNNFLKYLAVEALTGHWDGYSYNRNNFYLYKNTQTGRFEFIPYDTDNTFGIDWFNIDWATRNVTTWASSQARPLTKNILAVDVYRKRYYFYLKQLTQSLFTPSSVQAKAFAIRSLISPYAAADPYRPLDYGWSSSDFTRSYTEALGGHVKYGLIPYVTKRVQNAASQFSIGNIAPIISNVRWYAYGHKIPVDIQLDVDDEDDISSVNLFYSLDNGQWRKVTLTEKSGKRFKGQLGPWEEPIKSVSFYFEVSDKQGNKTREPLQVNYTINFNTYSLPVCINELMTSNTSVFPDEYGDYSDWIELYNYGSKTVSLKGFTLTDSLAKPGKWELPDIAVNPGEFLLLWADGQPEKGLNHLPFKLNSNGEEIGLFTPKADGYRLVDGFRFNKVAKNTSIGYYPNGIGLPQMLLSPTPGQGNVLTGIRVKMALPKIIAYPNPFYDGILITLSYPPAYDYRVDIFDIYGRLVHSSNHKAKSILKLKWVPRSGNKTMYLVNVTLHDKTETQLSSVKIIFAPLSN